MRQEQKLKEAGFEDVQTEAYKLPMGTWPKDQRLKTIGACNREQFLQGLNGIAMGVFTRLLGWKSEEVEVFIAKVRNDVNNAKLHGYWKELYSPFRSICDYANLVVAHLQQHKNPKRDFSKIL